MRFVQQLSADVAGPALELPSYPEVALRVQRVLTDANAGVERVVKVVGSEPVLASRILTMANSAALNRSGKPMTDLRAPSVRVGFDSLRTAAISFAVAQLRKAAEYKLHREAHEPAMAGERGHRRDESTCCRASCSASRPTWPCWPDWCRGVGKLYILTRSTRYPGPVLRSRELSIDRAPVAPAGRAQHPRELGSLSPEIIEAVGDIEEAALDDRGAVRPWRPAGSGPAARQPARMPST